MSSKKITCTINGFKWPELMSILLEAGQGLQLEIKIKKGVTFETVTYEAKGKASQLKEFTRVMDQHIAEHNAI
jgi:hypothetical protein